MRFISHRAFAGWLHGLALAVCRRPGWFVYPQILLALVCLLYAARTLQFATKRTNLIGPDVKSQRVYRAFRKEFPVEGNELVVVVESGRNERNRQFVERLAAEVHTETNLLTDLLYKTDLPTLGPKGLLLAPTSDLEQMLHRITQYRPFIDQFSQATNLDSLFSFINAQFRTAPSKPEAENRTLIEALPFLQTIITEGMQAILRPGRPPPPELGALLGGSRQGGRRVYITADEGRIYLLTLRAKNEAVTGAAIERLRDSIQKTQVQVPGVGVGLTGGPVLDYDEMHLAERDTTRASVVAFLLCLVLFIVAYREFGRPLKTVVCLMIGLGYTLGYTALVIGHLNVLTITFAPMLIGLAIDFGIHLITRYEEQMRKRQTTRDAIDRAMSFTGQGIVTGGLTTAGAFLAMALTHFKGIREMGIISGGGLLLCLVPMMTTLPVLLMSGRQNRRDQEIGPGGRRRLRIELLWLNHPRSVLLSTALLCIGAGLLLPRVHFDYNLLHMQSPKLPSVIYEEKLIRLAGASSLYGAVLADSPAQAREYEAKLRPLRAVAGVRSAADFLSPDQEQRLSLIRAIQQELAGLTLRPVDRRPVQLEAFSATLWSLSGYLGLAADAARAKEPDVARQLQSLRSAVTQFRTLMLRQNSDTVAKLTAFQQALFTNLHQTLEAIRNQDTSGPLRPEDLPRTLRDRFLGQTGKYLIQVYPRKDLWEHENQEEFIRELHSVIPPERVAGTPLELYDYTTLLKNSYQQAAGYALVAIIIMVLVHFRSGLSVALALLPVAIGSLWLLGFMGLTGVPFNPANVMTLPLVLGIGVTNGVQILNRYAEDQNPSILAKSTGKAVLVSGLTAIAGFGSLMLAGHRGIRSLGIVMSFGIAACMVAALTVLPVLLRMLERTQAPVDSAVTTARH